MSVKRKIRFLCTVMFGNVVLPQVYVRKPEKTQIEFLDVDYVYRFLNQPRVFFEVEQIDGCGETMDRWTIEAHTLRIMSLDYGDDYLSDSVLVSFVPVARLGERPGRKADRKAAGSIPARYTS